MVSFRSLLLDPLYVSVKHLGLTGSQGAPVRINLTTLEQTIAQGALTHRCVRLHGTGGQDYDGD
jgi:hypothetical protein